MLTILSANIEWLDEHNSDLGFSKPLRDDEEPTDGIRSGS